MSDFSRFFVKWNTSQETWWNHNEDLVYLAKVDVTIGSFFLRRELVVGENQKFDPKKR